MTIKSIRIAWSVIALTLAGCSSIKYSEDNEAKYHQLSANKSGNYESLYAAGTDYQCGLTAHLDQVIARIKSSGKKKILLSIHGGLNSVDANVKRVNRHYAKALDSGYYPIFIGWKSGAATTLKDRYFFIRGGINSPLIETLPSAPFYFASDLLRGVGSIPEAYWDQGKNLLSSHKKRFTGFVEDDIESRKTDFNDVKFYYTNRGDDKGFFESLFYTGRQVVPGVLRLVTTPLIEGVASESWNMMLRRTKTLMYRQADLSYRGVGRSAAEEYPKNCENSSPYYEVNKANGVLAQLMRAIKEYDPLVKITLVGHSMGAIIANDIVNEFGELKYEKIIHMGSADSIRNLMIKTVPYLDEHISTEYYNLMLHPTNEEQEQSVYGAAPEGSLLVWLDDMLINPETRLDRRAGRWDNIKWAFPYFKGKSNIHFKLFGLRKDSGGCREIVNEHKVKNCEPIKHGDFGNYSFWEEDFYWGKKKAMLDNFSQLK